MGWVYDGDRAFIRIICFVLMFCNVLVIDIVFEHELGQHTNHITPISHSTRYHNTSTS